MPLESTLSLAVRAVGGTVYGGGEEASGLLTGAACYEDLPVAEK